MTEQAQMVAKRSIELAPDAGPHKWLVLAQTSEGKEALSAYAKGSELLEAQHASAGDPLASQHLGRQVGSAYCAVAELFMTDLCYEPEAEASCEAAVQRGLAADPESAELLAAFANLRACQQRPAEARAILVKALDIMVRAMEAEGGTGDDEDDEDDAADAPTAAAPTAAASSATAGSSSAAAAGATPLPPVLPPFDCRFAAARSAIELSGGPAGLASGVLEPAARVLEGLVLEDEDHMESWFRLAEAQASMGDKEGAVDTLLVAQRLIIERMCKASARNLAVEEGGPEAAGGPARAASLDRIAAKLSAVGPEALPGAAAVGEAAAEELQELHVALRVMNTMGRAVVDGTWERAGPPAGEDGGATARAMEAEAAAAAGAAGAAGAGSGVVASSAAP